MQVLRIRCLPCFGVCLTTGVRAWHPGFKLCGFVAPAQSTKHLRAQTSGSIWIALDKDGALFCPGACAAHKVHRAITTSTQEKNLAGDVYAVSLICASASHQVVTRAQAMLRDHPPQCSELGGFCFLRTWSVPSVSVGSTVGQGLAEGSVSGRQGGLGDGGLLKCFDQARQVSNALC